MELLESNCIEYRDVTKEMAGYAFRLATELAVGCWRDPETSKTEMDPALARAFAKRLTAWIYEANHWQQEAAFWEDTCRENI
jgi:hypothetical protein